jgi:hypothetical protein
MVVIEDGCLDGYVRYHIPYTIYYISCLSTINNLLSLGLLGVYLYGSAAGGKASSAYELLQGVYLLCRLCGARDCLLALSLRSMCNVYV